MAASHKHHVIPACPGCGLSGHHEDGPEYNHSDAGTVCVWCSCGTIGKTFPTMDEAWESWQRGEVECIGEGA